MISSEMQKTFSFLSQRCSSGHGAWGQSVHMARVRSCTKVNKVKPNTVPICAKTARIIERFVPAGRGPSGANTLAQLVRAPARRCSGPEFEPGILRSTSTGFQLEKKSRYNRAEKKVAGRYMAPRTPRWPNGWPSPGRASNTHRRESKKEEAPHAMQKTS